MHRACHRNVGALIHYSVMTTSLSSLFRALGMLVPISLLAMGTMVRATTLPSTAFFYGSAMPAASLSKFDRIVVEAANVQDLSALRARGATVFAYVSVGEAEGWRDSTRALPPGFFLGANPDWQSRVADLTQAGWKKFLLEDRMASLWAQGYRAFFLDTLDSYQRYATTPAAQAVQGSALVDIIRSMHQRFPGVELLFNRGFELLPEVAPLSVGIVAESLFQSWNPASQEYGVVSPPDREWLLARLNEARDRYGLPVTVIDYVAPTQGELAQETARRIAALGFVPWVANPGLDVVFTGDAP
jgi:uncharacterized protein (TIGR01370 family)